VAIEFTCDCGATCSADESQVGQLIRCDACGMDVPVPSPHDAAEAGDQADRPAAGDQADVARAAVDDIVDAEAHAEAERAMIEQMKEIHGDPDQVASRRREDLDALKRETAGDVDPDDVKVKHDGDIQALYDQLGSEGGIAEMAREMEAVRDGEGGEGIALAPGELGPRTLRPVRTKPPKGKERAAHHIGFKKAIWAPSLLVGLVCVGIGVYCFLPSSEENPYKPHLAYFHETLKKARIGEFEVVQVGKGSWAIPKGATHSVSDAGRVYFQNVPAYGQMAPDEPAVDATDYVKATNYTSGRGYGYVKHGVALLAVGAILTLLSIITLRDVRIVAAMRAEQAAPDEAEGDEEAEGEPEAPDTEEVAEVIDEEAAPDQGPSDESPDEPSDDAEPPDESSDDAESPDDADTQASDESFDEPSDDAEARDEPAS